MQSGDKMTRSTESSTDNLTNAHECPICHKVGFHKLSCPTQKVTVFLSESGMSEFPTHHAIPTLEGDEAEEFIRKAESAERGTIDWSRQMKQMERILEKSRIANRESRIEVRN